MWGFIKGLREVQVRSICFPLSRLERGVRIKSCVTVTAASCSEAMLTVSEDIVITQVPYGATGDDMLLDLAGSRD